MSENSTKPRAYTAAETKEKFLRLLLGTADEWAGYEGKTAQERCEGMAFSMLATFDGSSVGFPAVDLVMRPHEDDKAYYQGEGENWIADGSVINERDFLHEQWHDFVAKVRAGG